MGGFLQSLGMHSKACGKPATVTNSQLACSSFEVSSTSTGSSETSTTSDAPNQPSATAATSEVHSQSFAC